MVAATTIACASFIPITGTFVSTLICLVDMYLEPKRLISEITIHGIKFYMVFVKNTNIYQVLVNSNLFKFLKLIFFVN